MAGLALRRLRRAGALACDDVVEGLYALLFRPERKLVDAGLGWLDQAVREHRGSLDAFAPALAHAFACRSYDVRARAVRLALRHAARFGPPGAGTLRDAAAHLPADLADRLTQAFPTASAPADGDPYERAQAASGAAAGASVEWGDDDFVRRALPRAPRPPSPLPPIGEPSRLPALPYRVGWQELERWLHAVVRFHAEDPESLRIALKALTGEPAHLYKEREWEHPGQWAEAIARQLVDPGAEPPPRARPALLPTAPGTLL
uniref:hypothetical protein n=1 Tax=Nonomuraea sp. SBT364 TaxID=1580530 RepID=UPI00066D7990